MPSVTVKEYSPGAKPDKVAAVLVKPNAVHSHAYW